MIIVTDWNRYGPKQYDWWRRAHSMTHQAVTDFIRFVNAKTALEFGGGDGHMARFVPGSYVVADVNREAIARATGNGIEGYWADWRKWDMGPLRSRKFEIVLALNVLEHAQRRWAVDRFLARAMLVSPKWICMSFALGLAEDRTHAVKHGTPMLRWGRLDVAKALVRRAPDYQFFDMLIPSGGEQIRQEELVILAHKTQAEITIDAISAIIKGQFDEQARNLVHDQGCCGDPEL